MTVVMLAALCAPGVASAALQAGQPSKLVALEKQMETLSINSERGTIVETVSGPKLGSLGRLFKARSGGPPRSRHRGGRSKGSVTHPAPSALSTIPLLTADFESSISPRLASAHIVLFGSLVLKERLIGEQAYVGSPLIAAIDGGRQWLSISPAELAEMRAHSKQKQSSLTPPIGATESSEAGFGKLAKLLAGARSVREVGPATVDGQGTTEFEGRLALKQLVGEIPSSFAKRRRREVKHAKASFSIFIASNGLPVRTRFQIKVGKVALGIDADILETEVPLTVTAPPASETITEAELKQREESGEGLHPPTRQEEAEQRRFVACVRKRLGKHPSKAARRRLNRTLRECQRIAKRGSK